MSVSEGRGIHSDRESGGEYSSGKKCGNGAVRGFPCLGETPAASVNEILTKRNRVWQ